MEAFGFSGFTFWKMKLGMIAKDIMRTYFATSIAFITFFPDFRSNHLMIQSSMDIICLSLLDELPNRPEPTSGSSLPSFWDIASAPSVFLSLNYPFLWYVFQSYHDPYLVKRFITSNGSFHLKARFPPDRIDLIAIAIFAFFWERSVTILLSRFGGHAIEPLVVLFGVKGHCPAFL